MAAPTGAVSLNSQKITGLADPTADADAAMAAANKKSASDFNATKVDTATLTDLFMNKKPYFKILLTL